MRNNQNFQGANNNYEESPVDGENGYANEGANGGSPQQFEEQQQEMDLNPYEDDDDETLHRKLIAAKIARKKAEEDMKLLSNRISLLKQEEQKVYKDSNKLNWIGMEEDRRDKEEG